MRLELHNINKIKHASIKIGGLTLIAGNNDSGKSTVGKMLFSLVKAISQQGEDIEESVEKEVFYLIEKLFFLLRRREDNIKHLQFKNLFFPPSFFEQIRECNVFSESLFGVDKEKLEELFRLRREFLIGQYSLFETEEDRTIVILNQIEYLCLSPKRNPEEAFMNALKKVIYSEFQSKICSDNTEMSSLSFSVGQRNTLHVEFLDNNIHYSDIEGELIRPFDDITFVETPLYLQLTYMLEQAQTLLDEDEGSRRFRPKVSFHIKDLINKVGLSKYSSGNESSEYLEYINQIIGGRFVYDKKSSQYLFIKGEGSPLHISNVASGIKSFGLIQLLLQVNELNEQKMLVIDEPENHLHPEWQLKFAHLIVLLVKANIPILLSTHSPYFIQAIKVYAQREGISPLVEYYLAEEDSKDENGAPMTTIHHVTDDLNRIFRKLAEPMHEIMRMNHDS